MLARKSLLLFTVNLARTLLGFLSTMAIARWMGAAALGMIGYMLGLVGMLAVLLDMGFAFAHLKRVSESDEDPAALIGTFLLIKTVLAMVFLVAAILLPFIKDHVGQPLLQSTDERWVYYIVVLFYIAHSLSTVILFTFEARLESAKQGIASFAGGSFAFLAKGAVAFFGLGIAALGIAYLIEPIVLLLSGVVLFGGYHLARPRRELVLNYFLYSLPLALHTAIGMVVSNVNPVILKAAWSSTEVGYYAAVLGFGGLLERVTSTVGILFLPQASSDAAQGNLADIRRRLSVTQRYVLTVMVPLAVGLIFFSREVVHIAFGSEFASAAPILMAVVVNSLLAAIFAPYSLVLYAVEQQRYLVVSNVLRLLVLLGANTILVPSRAGGFSLFGLRGTGSALALAAMTVAGGIAEARAANQSAEVGFYWKSALHLLAGVAMYLSMHLVGQIVPEPLWIKALLSMMLGMGAYTATMTLLGLLTRNDIEVFANMLNPQKMLEYISGELGRGA